MPGLQARNINTLHTRYICPVCSLILRHPLQINTCGHRLCQSCVRHNNQYVSTACPHSHRALSIYRATITCPQCQTPAMPHEVSSPLFPNAHIDCIPPSIQIASDRGFNNDMQSFPHLCLFCQWNGVLRDYHVTSFVICHIIFIVSFVHVS